jgi:arylsulfatase
MAQPGGFAGQIGRSREESTPAWDPPRRARDGAPNIVVILMDDMGWSDLGCYGGEIDTPNMDALAAGGLRFAHYTTHPICSPARAALLTGVNAHAAGTGWLSNNDPGYPGYRGEIPADCATLPETLRAAGYATFATGKWHNTPTLDCRPGGAKHSWPVQRGFDHFRGFMEGEAHFFFPAQLMNDNQVEDRDTFPRDYYATDDWMDSGIRFVKDLRASDPAKPFLLYVANNAPHAPLQAKPQDLAKYHGRYDAGWDAIRAARHRRQIEMGLIPPDTILPPSDPRAVAWEDTDPADREMLARHMECYAAMIDCVDQNVGKLVAFLERIGERDNTVILITSDNGGTDAGGPAGMFNNNRRYMGLAPPAKEVERATAHDLGSPRSASLYPTGWGQVSNTPFPSFKTYTGAGGRRVACIVNWPEGIADQGAVRRQFVHVTDVMPTLVDLAGAQPLAELQGRPARPLHGRSFAGVLKDAAAPAPRSEQYYECWSNRAYYRDGWLARSIQKRGDAIDWENWTLHDLTRDFSEATDLRARHPEKLTELVEAFDKAAWENGVYPLDNRDRLHKFADLAPWAKDAADKPRVFLPGTQTVHRFDLFPLIADRDFRIAARVNHRAEDRGIIWAIGDPTGGMVLWVEDGALHFHYNGFGDTTDLARSVLPPGEQTVTLEYNAQGRREGRGRLLLGEAELVPWTRLAPTMVIYGVFEGLDVGMDRRGPVLWPLYERHGAFPYTGTIHDVTVIPGARAPQ